jgi:aldose 1-epimerase
MSLTAQIRSFGRLPDGSDVSAVTLVNVSGMTVTLISYGAAIQSVIVPDRNGEYRDVTIGHAAIEDYLRWPQYAGATVGRFANRIAGGRFTLDDCEYRLPLNNGPNSLHGGETGFDRVNWQLREASARSAIFTMRSSDGDQGYPGNLDIAARYALNDDNLLSLTYEATTDAPTIIGLSNHAYWNLGGEGSGTAMDHLLQIDADSFLAVDENLIPTGERRPVAGTAFDFRAIKPIGRDLRNASEEQLRFGQGYDHNWIVGEGVASEVRKIARLEHPASGRVMTVHSNQPGLQFYSGNFFDGSTWGKSGGFYRMGDAIALEPQLFPDTPNRPEFGSALLDPGETYRNLITWEFTTA